MAISRASISVIFHFHVMNCNPSLIPIAEHVLSEVAEHVLRHLIMIDLATILTSRELLVEDPSLPSFY